MSTDYFLVTTKLSSSLSFLESFAITANQYMVAIRLQNNISRVLSPCTGSQGPIFVRTLCQGGFITLTVADGVTTFKGFDEV